MRTHKKRPASVTCPECHSRFAVKPHGRVPKFCCQRCRQRAAEKRKWLRPAPLVAIAHDIESARSRAAIREEAWLLLKQMRLMGPKAHPCENVREETGTRTAFLAFWPGRGRVCSGPVANWRFIACNHGVQPELDAMSSPRPTYCTQQTGGLTRGFTLRAIRTPLTSRAPRFLARSTVWSGVRPDPRHYVQVATVRFRTDGPSAPSSPTGRGRHPRGRRPGCASCQKNRSSRSGAPSFARGPAKQDRLRSHVGEQGRFRHVALRSTTHEVAFNVRLTLNGGPE